MSFIVLNIIYYLRLNQLPDKVIIDSMINIDETLAKQNMTIDNADDLLDHQFEWSTAVMDNVEVWMFFDGYLVLYCIQKFFFTALTLSCPIPGGIFTPTFAFGAVLGQLYVSLLRKILLFFGYVGVIQFRGVYSVLGAAAMTGCVTRTVSIAMIVLELNGHLSHAVPCMVAVLCSYATGEYIKSQSFFEMLSELGGLDDKVSKKGKIIIKDILSLRPDFRDFHFLSLHEST